MRLARRQLATMLAVVVIAYSGYGFACSHAPKTVADALTTLGNIKRDAKKAGEITAQQDLDISRKLDQVNRAYKQFVVDEQKRIQDGTPNTPARAESLKQLHSLVDALNDPALLGLKSDKAKKAWGASVGTLNSVLAAFGG